MKNYKTSPEKIVVVAYEGCPFTKGSKLKGFNWEKFGVLDSWSPMEGRLSLSHGTRFECIYNRDGQVSSGYYY